MLRKDVNMVGKVSEFLAEAKLKDLLKSKKDADCMGTLKKVLIVVGVVAIIAVIGYVVYRYLTPDYLEDFDDDFEDAFDDDVDDFFSDEEQVQVN